MSFVLKPAKPRPIFNIAHEVTVDELCAHSYRVLMCASAQSEGSSKSLYAVLSGPSVSYEVIHRGEVIDQCATLWDAVQTYNAVDERKP